MKTDKETFSIPLSVPSKMKSTYEKNYYTATKESNNLFLFAADQKIEHLNKDFFGIDIPAETNDPEYLFWVAKEGNVGAFATQLGLISSYGDKYRDVNYIVKLNSKTNIIPPEESDPMSLYIHTPKEVIEFKQQSKLNIVGLGYTLFLGSKYEAYMIREASETIYQAHQNGLFATLWIYPRGKSVKNERDADLIAGAAGVGACLGADFIKVNAPKADNSMQSAKYLKQATMAAGKSKVICAGGAKQNTLEFLQTLHEQINIGGTAGCAIGRNIFQRDAENSIKLCRAINSIVIEKGNIETALKYLE